jgi:hypothetical protein
MFSFTFCQDRCRKKHFTSLTIYSFPLSEFYIQFNLTMSDDFIYIKIKIDAEKKHFASLTIYSFPLSEFYIQFNLTMLDDFIYIGVNKKRKKKITQCDFSVVSIMSNHSVYMKFVVLAEHVCRI